MAKVREDITSDYQPEDGGGIPEDELPEIQYLRFTVAFPRVRVRIPCNAKLAQDVLELKSIVRYCKSPLIMDLDGKLQDHMPELKTQKPLAGLVGVEFVDADLDPVITAPEIAEDEGEMMVANASATCELELQVSYRDISEKSEADLDKQVEIGINEESDIQFREEIKSAISSMPGLGEISVNYDAQEVLIMIDTVGSMQYKELVVNADDQDAPSKLSEQQKAARRLEDDCKKQHRETLKLLAVAQTVEEKKQILQQQKQVLDKVLRRDFEWAIDNRDNLSADSSGFRQESMKTLKPDEKVAVAYALARRKSSEPQLTDAEIRQLPNKEAELTAKFYSGSSPYGDNLAVELALYHQRAGTPATGKEAEDCHRWAAMRTIGLTEEDLRQGNTFGRWRAMDGNEYIVQVMPEYSSTALTDLVIRVWDPATNEVTYLTDQYKSYERDNNLGDEALQEGYSPARKSELEVVMTRGKTANIMNPEKSLNEVMLRSLAWTGIIDSSAYVLKGEMGDKIYIHRTQVIKPEVREAIILSKQGAEAFRPERIQNSDTPPSYRLVTDVVVPGLKDNHGEDIRVEIKTDVRVRAVKNRKGEYVAPKIDKDGKWKVDEIKSSDATRIVVPDAAWTCLLETKTAGSNAVSIPGAVSESGAEAQIAFWQHKAGA